jgi:hypothetical protein
MVYYLLRDPAPSIAFLYLETRPVAFDMGMEIAG